MTDLTPKPFGLVLMPLHTKSRSLVLTRDRPINESRRAQAEGPNFRCFTLQATSFSSSSPKKARARWISRSPSFRLQEPSSLVPYCNPQKTKQTVELECTKHESNPSRLPAVASVRLSLRLFEKHAHRRWYDSDCRATSFSLLLPYVTMRDSIQQMSEHD